MTFGLTPEQQDLSDSVVRFAGRYAPMADTRAGFGALAAG